MRNCLYNGGWFCHFLSFERATKRNNDKTKNIYFCRYFVLAPFNLDNTTKQKMWTLITDFHAIQRYIVGVLAPKIWPFFVMSSLRPTDATTRGNKNNVYFVSACCCLPLSMRRPVTSFRQNIWVKHLFYSDKMKWSKSVTILYTISIHYQSNQYNIVVLVRPLEIKTSLAIQTTCFSTKMQFCNVNGSH